jgi:hypothetical protein
VSLSFLGQIDWLRSFLEGILVVGLPVIDWWPRHYQFYKSSLSSMKEFSFKQMKCNIYLTGWSTCTCLAPISISNSLKLVFSLSSLEQDLAFPVLLNYDVLEMKWAHGQVVQKHITYYSVQKIPLNIPQGSGNNQRLIYYFWSETCEVLTGIGPFMHSCSSIQSNLHEKICGNRDRSIHVDNFVVWLFPKFGGNPKMST